MARKYIKRMEDFKENSLQNEITDKIGNNKTNEKYFDNDITIIQKDGTKTFGLGFYTYRGLVCVLDGLGMDVEFDNYDLESQELIHSEIMSDNYS
jgi:hypothetical protein